MKHEVNLNKYQLRTDLLIDDFNDLNHEIVDVIEKEYPDEF